MPPSSHGPSLPAPWSCCVPHGTCGGSCVAWPPAPAPRVPCPSLDPAALIHHAGCCEHVCSHLGPCFGASRGGPGGGTFPRPWPPPQGAWGSCPLPALPLRACSWANEPWQPGGGRHTGSCFGSALRHPGKTRPEARSCWAWARGGTGSERGRRVLGRRRRPWGHLQAQRESRASAQSRPGGASTS